MFIDLRWRLLTAQLSVMAMILVIFGIGVYAFFWRSLYQQLDKKLLTLAQSATPTFASIEQQGETFLNQVDEVPWRDIFNRDQQSLEWFDKSGQQLASRGVLDLYSAPRVGNQTLNDGVERGKFRVYTISVFEDTSSSNTPTLIGYVRASQSLEDIEILQRQLLWGLAGGGTIAIVLTGVGGLWLTRRSLQPIEKSFETLRQFTADASHELRNPLTAIKTSIDIIQKHPERVHPKDVKKLEAIASATEQMRQITEDLLLLARSDTRSSSSLSREVVHLNQLVADLVTLLEPSAQTKAIDLQLICRAELWVQGDLSRLYRVFSNMLHNAIQYTPHGGRVRITLVHHSRWAIAIIEDTGIGITDEQLPQIFDRFWRADKARSWRQGGMGLGLSIAQAIAQQHGGMITVTSRLGKGSCFRVTLPLAETAQLL